MESFVAQPGEPLLRFTAANGGYTAQQSRFYLTPPTSAPAAQQWTVPVCVRGGACQVVTGAGNVTAPSAGAFANGDAKGYYRSSYDNASLRALLGSATTLKAPERISLVGDRYALLRAGEGTVSSYLDLVAALRNDPNAQVLNQSLSGLGSIRQRVATDAQDTQMKAWVRTEFAPVYASLGPATPGESLQNAQRRSILFSLLGRADDASVVAEARTMAQRYMAGNSGIDPELAQTAVGIAAEHGDSTLYDALQHVAETSTNPEHPDAGALHVGGVSKSRAGAAHAWTTSASGKVRNQDSWILLSDPCCSSGRRARRRGATSRPTGTRCMRSSPRASGNRVVSATGALLQCRGSGGCAAVFRYASGRSGRPRAARCFE